MMTNPISNSPSSQSIKAQSEPSKKTGRFAKLNYAVSKFSLISLLSRTIKFARGKTQKNETPTFKYSNPALNEITLDDINAKLKALNPHKKTIEELNDNPLSTNKKRTIYQKAIKLARLERNLENLSKEDKTNPLLAFDRTEKIILEIEIKKLRHEIKALKDPFERVRKLEERKTQLENLRNIKA
jgi:hypothetical protein